MPTSLRALLVSALTVVTGLSVYAYFKAVEEAERLRALLGFRGNMRE